MNQNASPLQLADSNQSTIRTGLRFSDLARGSQRRESATGVSPYVLVAQEPLPLAASGSAGSSVVVSSAPFYYQPRVLYASVQSCVPVLGSRKMGASGRFQQYIDLVEPVVLLVTNSQGERFLFDDSTQDSVSKMSDSNDMLHSSDTLSDYVSQITSSIPIRFRRFCNLPGINSAVEHIQDILPVQDSSLTTSLSASGSFFSFDKLSYAFQSSDPTAR